MSKVIVVETQLDIDKIPTEYDGKIFINGGSMQSPIKVRIRYIQKPIAINNSFVRVMGNARLLAEDTVTVYAYHNTRITASGSCTVFIYDNATATCHGSCIIIAMGKAKAYAFGFCNVILKDMSICRASGNTNVLGFHKTRSYLRQESRAFLYDDKARAYCRENAKAIH